MYQAVIAHELVRTSFAHRRGLVEESAAPTYGQERGVFWGGLKARKRVVDA